jgi:hypothetical protein
MEFELISILPPLCALDCPFCADSFVCQYYGTGRVEGPCLSPAVQEVYGFALGVPSLSLFKHHTPDNGEDA